MRRGGGYGGLVMGGAVEGDELCCCLTCCWCGEIGDGHEVSEEEEEGYGVLVGLVE